MVTHCCKCTFISPCTENVSLHQHMLYFHIGYYVDTVCLVPVCLHQHMFYVHIAYFVDTECLVSACLHQHMLYVHIVISCGYRVDTVCACLLSPDVVSAHSISCAYRVVSVGVSSISTCYMSTWHIMWIQSGHCQHKYFINH